MVVSPDAFQLARRDIAALAAPPSTARGTWVTLSLTSPWTVWDANWDAPSYLKDTHGFVHLRGLLNPNGTPIQGVMVATLPAGVRPLHQHYFAAPVFNTQIAMWYVWPNGQITLQGITGGTYLAQYYSWAGFTWPAEQ